MNILESYDLTGSLLPRYLAPDANRRRRAGSGLPDRPRSITAANGLASASQSGIEFVFLLTPETPATRQSAGCQRSGRR